MKGEGFLTRNISSFTGTLESVMAAENTCRAQGMLQSLDPRAKLIATLLFIVTVGLARSFPILAVIFVIVFALSFLSRVPPGFFIKRVLLFAPFTAVIAIPALFITPGEPLVNLAGRIIVTEQGARTAGLLIFRVTDSVSLSMLLILTTPWNNLLAALRRLHVPALVVDILAMTYRYIFVLLHTTNSMFLARRSRALGSFSDSENRRWLARTLATTMTKSQHLSEEVYLAMLSRGYQGEIYTLNRLTLRQRDYIWGTFSLALVSVLLWSNYR